MTKTPLPTPLQPEVYVHKHDAPAPPHGSVVTPKGSYWVADNVRVWMLWDATMTIEYGCWRIRIDIYEPATKDQTT
jgi:hypothetical protein